LTSGVLTLIDAATSEKGFQTKHAVDLAATAITLIPVVGEVFAPLWFTANLVSLAINGKSISENIQDKIDNK